MNSILRILSIALLFVVVVSLPISLMVRNTESVLFSPEQTLTLMKKNLVNHEVMTMVARKAIHLEKQNINQPVDQMMAMALFSVMDKGQWKEFFEMTIPEPLIHQYLETILDGFYAWLDSHDDYPEIQLGTLPFTQNLEKNMGGILDFIFNMMPECRPENLEQLSKLLNSEGIKTFEEETMAMLPKCAIPEPEFSQLKSFMVPAVSKKLEPLPKSIELEAIVNPDIEKQKAMNCLSCHDHGITKKDPHLEQFVNVKAELNNARKMMKSAWIAVSCMLIFGVLLTSRSKHSFSTWIGWSLMLSGILGVILAMSLLFNASGIIQMIINSAPELPPSPAIVGIESLFGGLFSNVGRSLLFRTLILAVSGSVLIFIGKKFKAPIETDSE